MKMIYLFLIASMSLCAQGSFMRKGLSSITFQQPPAFQSRNMLTLNQDRGENIGRSVVQPARELAVWNKLMVDSSRGDFNAVFSFFASPNMIFIDINKVDDQSGDTLLIRAVESKKIDMVKLLIYLGADINKPNSSGSTSLMKAIYSRDRTMIRYVLSLKDISLDVKNNLNETALIVACTYGDIDTIKQLVTKGANVALKDNQGQSAYDRLRYFSSDSHDYKSSIDSLRSLLQQLVAEK